MSLTVVIDQKVNLFELNEILIILLLTLLKFPSYSIENKDRRYIKFFVSFGYKKKTIKNESISIHGYFELVSYFESLTFQNLIKYKIKALKIVNAEELSGNTTANNCSMICSFVVSLVMNL